MSTKPSRTAVRSTEERARKQAADTIATIQSATDNALAGRATWKEVSDQYRFAELLLNGLRFSVLRALQARRPAQLSFRAREMAETLASWADALDDVETAGERRAKIQGRIEKLRVAMTRIASPVRVEGSDLVYLRTAFIGTVERVAELGNTVWKNVLPQEPGERWLKRNAEPSAIR